MTVLIDTVESLSRIQDIVFENAPADLLFGFEYHSGRDASGHVQNSMFDQNLDFVLFEAEIDTTRRAGPSRVSPGRAWGSLTITLHTKNSKSDITQKRRLEVLSAWFAEKTLKDIRFRTWLPLSTARVMGFMAYSGVLSFDFETQPKGLPI